MSMEVDEEVDISANKAESSASVTFESTQNGEQIKASDKQPIERQASEDTKSTSCSLIFTLQGHKKSVSSLAISPDGTEIVSSGADGLLKIWSLATGSLRATLDAHDQTDSPSSTQRQGISDVAWSSDGKYIVCGGDDKLVRVWHAKRLELLCEFEGHTSFIFCVSFNPNVTLAVSGSFDESVRMWDLQKKRCHRTIAAHSEAVTGVAFNRDGSILASCSYDGLIRLWDAFTGQCLKTLVHGEAMPIGHVVFSPNGFQLLATSLDNSIRLWDMANGRVLKPTSVIKAQSLLLNLHSLLGTRTTQAKIQTVSMAQIHNFHVLSLQEVKIKRCTCGICKASMSNIHCKVIVMSYCALRRILLNQLSLLQVSIGIHVSKYGISSRDKRYQAQKRHVLLAIVPFLFSCTMYAWL
ncbi:hypothetical protein L7F22_052650 [Adiantum nelumboides]|nr:hypothetical protein [Adiantum nelumboides]